MTIEQQILKQQFSTYKPHCLTHQLAKNAINYGFHSLMPAHKRLLQPFLRNRCQHCGIALFEQTLLSAYQAKTNTIPLLLCEQCR